ncbi:NDP-sugar pyrophosphorylase family protein [Streptomyces sp. B4I13]|uniref:hypothetical protein n=1 Tax=Streptomyces sp. B4I13 TaxID=3042271 RepID=UPI00278B98EA|nr:hypothetical protein [Streptomyces sp. B4I13]MDQ0960745.1 NDP-sugar pyrophosphorylase family protein [Streptomyces sp. B4I13]
MTATSVLLAAANAGAATADDEPVLAEGAMVVLNDGTVIGADDEIEFSFTGDKSEVKRMSHVVSFASFL